MSERMRERASRGPSFIEQLIPEGKRHVYGTIKTKSGTYEMDDYRYSADGKMIEFIQSYKHDVIAIPTQQVEQLRVFSDAEKPHFLAGGEETFRQGGHNKNP